MAEQFIFETFRDLFHLGLDMYTVQCYNTASVSHRSDLVQSELVSMFCENSVRV